MKRQNMRWIRRRNEMRWDEVHKKTAPPINHACQLQSRIRSRLGSQQCRTIDDWTGGRSKNSKSHYSSQSSRNNGDREAVSHIVSILSNWNRNSILQQLYYHYYYGKLRMIMIQWVKLVKGIRGEYSIVDAIHWFACYFVRSIIDTILAFRRD